jgi:hypothetical protein
LAGVANARMGRNEFACAWARMSAACGALGTRISRSPYFDQLGIHEGPFDILEKLAPTKEEQADGKRKCDEARALRPG